MNIYIIYTLNEYIKDRDTDLNNYIITGEKPIKINLYGMSIIVVDILNSPDIIIFVDIIYCFIFFANIILAKHFQLKGVYLNKEYN